MERGGDVRALDLAELAKFHADFQRLQAEIRALELWSKMELSGVEAEACYRRAEELEARRRELLLRSVALRGVVG